MNMTKVCHISSAHSGLDSRIFIKECISLAQAGYETHLVISATYNEVLKAQDKGIVLHAIPESSGRFSRLFFKVWQCWREAKAINADIYHFHDPELIPVGIIFTLTGKKVIYDVHEDLPKDILSKYWIPSPIRKGVAWFSSVVEYVGAKTFACIVTATPFIESRFKKHSKKVISIKNYPRFDKSRLRTFTNIKTNHVCYIGSVCVTRGIEEICQAVTLAKTGPRLLLAGTFNQPELFERISASSYWEKVDYKGEIEHEKVIDLLQQSSIGLVTLHPIVNFIDALPIKLFEYMQAGIPVIASDFPLWREIVESCRCGILVDPMNPKEISNAIDYLIQNPDLAKEMGNNGRNAAFEIYNWETEEKSLISLYRELLE